MPGGNGGDGAVAGGRGGGRRTIRGRRGRAIGGGGRRAASRRGRGPFGPGLLHDGGASADTSNRLELFLDTCESPARHVRAPGGADVGVGREGDDETRTGILIVQSGPRARCGARDLYVTFHGAALVDKVDLVHLHGMLARIRLRFGGRRRGCRRGRCAAGLGGRDPCRGVDDHIVVTALLESSLPVEYALPCIQVQYDIAVVGAEVLARGAVVLDPHTSDGHCCANTVGRGIHQVVPRVHWLLCHEGQFALRQSYRAREGGDAYSCGEHPEDGQNDRRWVASRAAARVFVYHYVSLDNFHFVRCCTDDRWMGPNFVLEHPILDRCRRFTRESCSSLAR